MRGRRTVARSKLVGTTVAERVAAASEPVAVGARASMPPPALPSLDTPEYRVETDAITYKGNGDFTMPHHVALSRPGSDAVADQRRRQPEARHDQAARQRRRSRQRQGAGGRRNDQYAKGGPSSLTCDELDVDSKAKIYIASGHMHFEQGERKADAERGVLNRGSGMLHLQGDVKTTDGTSTITAQNLDYNINTKKILADGKPIVIKQPVPTPGPGSALAVTQAQAQPHPVPDLMRSSETAS